MGMRWWLRGDGFRLRCGIRGRWRGGVAVAGGEGGPRAVRAPMPGRVVRVLAAEGDEVAEQQGVVVLEAMKMQNEMRSPKAGRIRRVAVQVGDTVAAGDLLALVE